MEDPTTVFNNNEDLNGINASFNILPTNRIDAVTCAFPVGCNYTPLKQIYDIDPKTNQRVLRQPLPYEPISCRACHSILNPFSEVDYTKYTYKCPICGAFNPLPSSYNGMQPNAPAQELYPNWTTAEYTINTPNLAHPIFLFCVDTVQATEKENIALKDILLQTITLIPRNAYVGFITFGNLIYLHELRFSDFPRSFVFSGNKNYDISELSQMLSLPRNTPGQAEQPNPFIMPVEDAEQMLTSIIDALKIDQTIVPKTDRSPRCTGAALHLSVALIEALYPAMGGQIFLMSSGPITKGSGSMASKVRSELIRQHADIEKDKASLTKEAVTFFSELGTRAASKNIIINYLSGAFEETGLYELEPCILKTGGWLLSAESWTDANIMPTFQKYFTSIFPTAGSDCSIHLIVPPKLFKISGCIGPCTVSTSDSNEMVAEKTIGLGGTNVWKITGILPTTTLSFYFDIAASKADPVPSGTFACFQIITSYRHIATGQYRKRVTTQRVQFLDLTANVAQIGFQFNQFAGAVLLARQAMWKVREEEVVDVLHFIDRSLIRFCRKFGTYTENDPSTFIMNNNFAMLPQFMYHLRRSPFMATFNFSPDYTTSLRHELLTQDTNSILYMIQPSLMMYSLQNCMEPQAVALDAENIRPDVVLLLDTFFRVLVWHGKNICEWRNMKLQEDPQWEALKIILESPLEEGKALCSERFPTPLFVVCDEGSSQSRYLLARCNPVHIDRMTGTSGDSLGGTDDPSLAKFMQKLKEVSVQR